MRKPTPLAIHVVELTICEPFSWPMLQCGLFANIELYAQENREG